MISCIRIIVMTEAKKQERKKRVRRMIAELEAFFPNVEIALNYKNNWQLLVAVVLSAQTTDKKVNEITPALFGIYESVDDFARAQPEEIAKHITSVNYYNNKAKNLVGAAKMLKDTFHGKLPKTIKEMVELPGIGRKSANVILGNAYGLSEEGIAVDTHVIRLSRKYDLTDYSDPIKIERDLMEIVPKRKWFEWTYLLVEFGRTYCPARKHDCTEHPVTHIYPAAAKTWPRAG